MKPGDRKIQPRWVDWLKRNFSTGRWKHTEPELTTLVTPCKSEFVTNANLGFSDFRIVQDHPDGYPFLAALQDFEENFMVYRKFGFLQAQILLDKQKELRELEIELGQIDAEGQRLDPRYLYSLAGTSAERKDIICEIEQKFKEYGKQ